MADKSRPTIQIGQMNLRIPGESADYGHRVAQGLSERLANRVPSSLECRLGALNVPVRPPVGAGEAEMSNAIAEAIANALRRNHRA